MRPPAQALRVSFLKGGAAPDPGRLSVPANPPALQRLREAMEEAGLGGIRVRDIGRRQLS